MCKVKFLQSKHICISTLSYALHTLCGGHFRPLTGSAPNNIYHIGGVLALDNYDGCKVL